MPFYISPPGIVCPLGSGCQAVAQALFAGDRTGLRRHRDWSTPKPVFCGEVLSPLPSIPLHLAAFSCRNNQLLVAAVEQIRSHIEVVRERYGANRVAVVIGSSTSGIAEGGEAVRFKEQTGSFPAGFDYVCQEIGSPAEFLGRYLELDGICYTVSTACTSSLKAFASARNLLQAGLADAVVVGGADSLCELTVRGFAALESVSAGLCTPFSAVRDGINIGEGAALFVMSREPDTVCVSGIGESSDAYHISAPDPEAYGAEAAMRAALQQSGLAASDIAYINLHGTATRKNDEMEAKAVFRVFGPHTPCSSTKAMTGHLLGAAGATEIAYCWMTLQAKDYTLPPQVGTDVMDADLPSLQLVTLGFRAHQKPVHVMSTNYAFGGSNAAIILSRS